MKKTRRTFIYTITRNSDQKHYIVSKEAFEDRLALQLGDTDVVGGWCGITSANYDNARKMIRKMKDKRHCGLLCSHLSYRIFDSDEFKTYNKDNKYSLYLGDVMAL